MPMARAVSLLCTILLGCQLLSFADAAGKFGACYGNLKEILSEGGFTGEPDCTKISVDLNFVGEIKVQNGSVLQVYNLIYHTISDGSLPHGGQRIIIVRDGKAYLGQYAIPTPPFRKLRIQDGSVYIDVEPSKGNRIDLSGAEIPRTAYLDQEVFSFFR